MVSVNNSQFYGVKWDGQAIEAVNNVSRALLNISELFKSQNIHIDCLLNVAAQDTMEAGAAQPTTNKAQKPVRRSK